MRNKFDMQLDTMNDKLLEMGELCVKAIANAVTALENGDRELAHKIIREDEEIDQIEKDIERLCLKLLLQQQPVARDLRQISAALKMITDMERIGDQAGDIADIILSADRIVTEDSAIIVRMADAVSQMVRESIEAFVKKDLGLTRQVMKADDEVDHWFDEAKEKLIDFIRDNGESGEVAIDFIMTAKYLERIGDHATNIAEWVEFSITGVHEDSNQSRNG